MLRLQPSSAVLPISRLSSVTAFTTTPSRSMSTDGTVRPPHGARVADMPEEVKKPAELKPSHAFLFPLGYKDAAYQWWTSLAPQAVERNLLNLMPHLKEANDSITNIDTPERPDPYGTRVWRRTMVHLSGKNRALNEVTVERVGEKTEDALVMIHGYGAGLGFFYKNFEPISRMKGLKLYALDMLGCGNSSRPAFKIHAKKKEDQVLEAEGWFVDALEEWRKARQLEQFTLLGHSLGGYLAVSYALKYPGRLKKLILASPVGIPADPYAVNASMPDPNTSTIQNEITQDQQSTTNEDGTLSKHKPASNVLRRPLPGWFVWLWDQNISPFSIVRMSGPLGPRFVSGWSFRRFNHLPPAESQALHDYSFSIFKQKGSGEYALAYILAPGAYARRPVIHRIQEVGRQTITQPDGTKVKETGIPVVFMYGENDWMDVAGGLASEEKLKEARQKALENATEEEKKRENGSAKVLLVPKAGHHLYLDNPEVFNDMIRKELEDTRKSEQSRQ
ncbi:alpha beta hydrolase [Fusarium beomiforme]|uniref:Alpha beta hydrolase n=1 Tax=Fusarium beomiforme TaxID=44412 RepID=A0A9P5A6S4_9HYPO|nr:alpha beta hydrolase [Fusarium beomiforme]